MSGTTTELPAVTVTAAAPPQYKEINGPRNWIRRLNLLVGNPQRALDLSDFHVSFKILQNEIQTPNNAVIRIFNLHDKTARLVQREFTRVQLSAGYKEGNFGLLFDGQIKQVRIGKESAIDKYVDIIAADSDIIYNYATISVTLAAGSTPEDVINATMAAINRFVTVPRAAGLSQEDIQRSGADFAVTLGPLPQNMGSQRLPRGRVLFGMVREVLRQVADILNCNWTILNRVLTFTPRVGYVEGDIVVLTSRSGLIRFPEQTQDGIAATMLINANVQIGRRVRIDNASVQQARFGPEYGAEVRYNMLPQIANDGLYKVVSVDWSGDTHGNDWYGSLNLLSLDPTGNIPFSVVQRGRIVPP